MFDAAVSERCGAVPVQRVLACDSSDGGLQRDGRDMVHCPYLVGKCQCSGGFSCLQVQHQCFCEVWDGMMWQFAFDHFNGDDLVVVNTSEQVS